MTMRLSILLLFSVSVAVSQNNDVSVFPDSSNDAYVWYQFKPLGISFRSFAAFHQPFNLDRIAPLDLSTWKFFSSAAYGIQFSYPPSLSLRLSGDGLWRAKGCDAAIEIVTTLVEHVSDDSTVTSTYPIIEIFSSKATFEEIAEDQGFEFGLSSDDEDNSSRRVWSILGRQGMKEGASLLHGNIWIGLRGENLTGTYGHTEGYLMSVPFVSVFLMRSCDNKCNLVATFGKGPTGYADDELRADISEEDFYYLVASIRLLR
jgi:hypothetical protein